MVLSLQADWVTGIDESGGNQVVAGVKHDVSSFDATLTGLYNDQLAAFYGNTDTTLADAIQLAGYPDDGDPTTMNDVVVTSDGNVTGLSLTDGDGNLFDGTYDSGLTTLEGHQINLLSGTDNNFVLGIDSVTGDVIFMIHISEELDANDSVIGGDFSVALFSPLNHGDDNNDFDSVVDLTNRIFVSAEQIIDFDFTGAPSGQNYFMAFYADGVTIVASGETATDTVNSGQGANLPDDTDKTALGSNSQNLEAQQLLNINYTTGFNTDYVVPNLSSTEASDVNNIQFTNVYGSTGAGFNVVKVTGGPASTAPLVHISAWNTEVETGADFIPGHADDVQVNIIKVLVNGVDVTGDSDMVTDNGDGTFTVIGAVENDRIQIMTDGTHNRLAIKNDGTDNVKFSVQAFALESTSLETTEVGSNIDFYDSGPTAGGLAIDLDLWEDALPSIGNPDGDTGEQYIALGSLTGLFDPGTDVTGFSFGISPTAPTTVSTIQGPGDLTFDVTITEGANVVADGVTYDDQIMLSIGGTDHLQLLVKADGSVRLELLVPLDHSLVNNPSDNDNEIYSLQFGDLFAAFDGDGDYVAFQASDVGSDIEDDAPTFSMTDLDTDLQTDDGDLEGGNTGDGTGTDSDTKTGAALFSTTSSAGADGDGGTVYNLELGGTTATNLVDTATGNSVFLFDSGGVIQGREGTDATDAATGEIVFTVSVDGSTGDVTLTQNRAVEHSTADTSGYASDTTGLGVTDAIYLRGTLSDGESSNPDTATDFIDLSDNLVFTDDGPAFSMTDLDTDLQTDDGDLEGGNTGDGTGTDSDTKTGAALFSTTSSAGADGDGGTVYNLELGGTTATNLVDTATGNSVFLFDSGGVIQGREGTDATDAATGEIVFTVSVDGSTGDVTLTQNRAVEHSTADTSGYASDTTGLGVTDAIYLRGTLSDGESSNPDTATDFIDLSDNLVFTDDGPAIDVLNASGTYGTGASGNWSDAPGADGEAQTPLSVSLDGYQITGSSAVDVSPDLALSDQGNGLFTFSITDDFNGDGTDETIPFELQFNGDGTYDLTTDTPPLTVVDFDTQNGQLDAGGPDPVRTLTVGDFEIVFSAVDPIANPSDIEADLNTGEAHIETTAGYLSDDELNVSTSGIANGNNVFEGNALAGEPDGVETKGGKVDESFVVDPNVDVSSVKVFIDNSVGGYDTSKEELYYRVYDNGGGWTDWMLVEEPLTPEAGGMVSFTIGDPDGPNYIDAVQLGMGTGTIKIPVIAFTTSLEFDPYALTLEFDATLTDGDGDTHTDDFTVFMDVDPVV